MPPLPAQIDYDLVERTGQIMASIQELAVVLGLKLSTVRRLLQTDERFAMAWEKGQQTGKSNLRRKQLQIVDEGHWVRDPRKRVNLEKDPAGQEGYTFIHTPQATHMLIHLGKTLLGQSEKLAIDAKVKVSQEASRASEALMNTGTFDPMKLDAEERTELSELCELVDRFGMPGIPPEQQDRIMILIRKGFIGQKSEKSLPAPIDVEYKEAA